MKQKKKLKVEETEKVFDYLKIKNFYYQIEMSKDGKPLIIQVDKKEVEQKIRKAKRMAKKLKDGLDKEAVLVEALMINLDDSSFDKLYNSLFKSKRKLKPRTRKGHCVDMKIGNQILPLVT